MYYHLHEYPSALFEEFTSGDEYRLFSFGILISNDPQLSETIYEMEVETVFGARRTCCNNRAASRCVMPPITRSPRLRASGC